MDKDFEKEKMLANFIYENNLLEIKNINNIKEIINEQIALFGLFYFHINNERYYYNVSIRIGINREISYEIGYYLHKIKKKNKGNYSVGKSFAAPFITNDLYKFDDNLRKNIKFGFGKNTEKGFEKWTEKYGVNKYGDTIEWSCLNYAIALNKTKIVEYLLIEGADPYLKDKLNENSLDLAKFMENEEIIKLIKLYDPVKLNFKKKIENFDINFYYK
jgi:hypothetical protein